MTEINSSQNKDPDIELYDNINATTSSTQLYILYHESEIKHNDKAYKTFRGLLWAGFIVIIVGIIGCFFNQITSGIIISVSGILTEFISATVVVILDRSSKSKLEYYKQLSFDEEFTKMLEMIHTINSEEYQKELLTKLVDNYCARRK